MHQRTDRAPRPTGGVPLLLLAMLLGAAGCGANVPPAPVAPNKDLKVTVLEGPAYGVAIGPDDRLAAMLWLSETVRLGRYHDDHAPVDAATGAIPVHGAFSMDGRRVFVVEQDGHALRAIDATTGVGIARPYGHVMFNIAVAPRDGAVYATTGDGWLFKVDPATLAKVDSVHLGAPSNGLAVNTKALWVSTLAGMLYRIDPKDLEILDRIGLGGRAQRIAIDAGATTAYVANEGGLGLQVVDLTDGTVRSFPEVGVPYGVALTPDGRELWVALPGQGRVDRFAVPGMTPLGSLLTGGSPRNITFARHGRFALIGNEVNTVLVDR